MSAAGYVPETGDIVWLDFSPQTGHEQAGRRPAFVLTPAIYNRHGLMLCCPMTTKRKGYPFEVVVEDGSIVLADQVKSVDWRKRNAQLKSRASDAILKQVRAKAIKLIGGS
ncbi:mRNA interferase MazF [Neorhizobium huautlense]|uniref:mRNA interferase MazF n=1 Tax=Neorhizobium huautlense TaxID=67774 RepID=A0ABT9PNV5_9HYPH|nr:endoribonuclease MazF [Neorhizobium huautlense]MDP9836141.1 mRNA interferase MazF [Neorhizobium huautlense]